MELFSLKILQVIAVVITATSAAAMTVDVVLVVTATLSKLHTLSHTTKVQ